MLHPSEYPWSSYHHNALGQPNEWVTPHLEYRRLDKTDTKRQAAYRQLFKHHLSENSIAEIREATNKAWVLRNDRFKKGYNSKWRDELSRRPRVGIENQRDLKSIAIVMVINILLPPHQNPILI